jgi:hypothetical protein
MKLHVKINGKYRYILTDLMAEAGIQYSVDEKKFYMVSQAPFDMVTGRLINSNSEPLLAFGYHEELEDITYWRRTFNFAGIKYEAPFTAQYTGYFCVTEDGKLYAASEPDDWNLTWSWARCVPQKLETYIPRLEWLDWIINKKADKVNYTGDILWQLPQTIVVQYREAKNYATLNYGLYHYDSDGYTELDNPVELIPTQEELNLMYNTNPTSGQITWELFKEEGLDAYIDLDALKAELEALESQYKMGISTVFKDPYVLIGLGLGAVGIFGLMFSKLAK